MKIKDILTETSLNLNQQRSIPDMKAYGVPGMPIGPTNYYHKYRLGVMMAGSPDNAHDYNPEGELADDMVILGYSKADQEILDKALTKFGWKTNSITPKGSQESPDVQSVSPVSNWNTANAS